MGRPSVSDYLILSAWDKRWLKGILVDPGPTMDERLLQFADSLNEREYHDRLNREQGESMSDSMAAE
jgi:hypothetical protein